MSVYHCPLCPLIFQYRTEAEWHLREEHRSRADEEADLNIELSAATRPVDWRKLSALRASEGIPSVTLVLSTAPAPSMTVLDVARLRQLAERARRRLSGEPHAGVANSVVEHRLAKAVSTAESLATDRGLVILVNRRDMAIATLPFAPRDRHVVDDHFATRDLEYALRRHPRYRVLLLGSHPRILEGPAHRLAEPAAGEEAHPADRHHPDPDPLLARRLDAAGDLPLVVIGDSRHIADFRRQSRYSGDVVAEISRSRFHRSDVGDLVCAALARLHHERHARAVDELLHADMQAQVAWGVQAAWNAVHNRAADRLWVEHDYAVPGRVSPGVYGVQTVPDAEEPGVIDDLVDALLSRASQLGIPTELLDKGALERPEPVAVKIPVPGPGRPSPGGTPGWHARVAAR